MARAIIEILGDASSAKLAAKETSAVYQTLERDTKQLAVSARSSAQLQIDASLRKTARLRAESAAFHAAVNTEVRGSERQAHAATLASRADLRLARAAGVTSRESAVLSARARTTERSLGRATRGALAGSGIFRGLGRSIAFASGGFLAFATAGQFLRTSIDAAKEAAVAQRQLGKQLQNDGESLKQYRGQIDQTGLRLSALSGFTKDDLDQALTTILRSTKNVGKALRDEGTAADLARAKHIKLSQAALILGKVEAGNTTLLRRQGFRISKTATAEQALAIVRAKIAGQAKAGTTEQERFGAVLHDSEVIIGAGLLPTLNKYLAKGATWLSQMNQSGRLQKDVASATKTAGDAFGAAKTLAEPLIGTFRILERVSGGTKQALELLGGAFVVLEGRAKLIKWGLISSEIGSVGTSATIASGEVATLRTRLLGLSKLGPIAVAIALSFVPSTKKGQKALDKAGIGLLGRLPIIGGAEQQVARAGQATHDFLFGPPKPTPTPSKPLSPARAALKQTFAEAKLLNPQLTRRAFDLGQQVARAYLKGLTQKTGDVTLPSPKLPKTLSLKGRFNLAELRLANAELTKTSADDKAILQTEAGIVRQQIAGTKNLKDKTALTLQLVGIMGQLKGLAKEASDNFTLPERLTLAAAKASATATQKDDLAAARETKAFVSKLIASGKLRGQALEQAYGDLASANDQLLAAQKDAAQKTLARITGRQFRALGLDATGAALTPNAKSLRKDLGKLSTVVAGTFLDTTKTQSILSRIRRVLAGGLGAVSKDVRSTIKGMLDDLDQQLKDHTDVPVTKFAKATTRSVLAGIPLSPADEKKLRARLSVLGVGGTVPRQTATGGGFGGQTITINHTTKLDGRVVEQSTTRHQEKRARRNPRQKRGPHA